MPREREGEIVCLLCPTLLQLDARRFDIKPGASEHYHVHLSFRPLSRPGVGPRGYRTVIWRHKLNLFRSISDEDQCRRHFVSCA